MDDKGVGEGHVCQDKPPPCRLRSRRTIDYPGMLISESVIAQDNHVSVMTITSNVLARHKSSQFVDLRQQAPSIKVENG